MVTPYYAYNPYLIEIYELFVSRFFIHAIIYDFSEDILEIQLSSLLLKRKNEIAGTHGIRSILNLVVYRGHYYFEN